MNILRDPIWQFISVFLALVDIVFNYFTTRLKKSLSYHVISETALLKKMDEDFREKIKILYKEKPDEEKPIQIPSAHLIVLRILNDGNVCILPNDFHGSIIGFSFGKETTVLDFKIKDTFPEDFTPPPLLEKQSSHLKITPLVLDSGDTVTINVLVAGYNGQIKPVFRIAEGEVKRISGMYTFVGTAIFTIGIMFLSILFSLFARLSIAGAFKDERFVGQLAFCILLIFTGLITAVLKLPSRVKPSRRYASVGTVIFITGIVLLSVLFSLFAKLSIARAFSDGRFVGQFIFCIFLIFAGLITPILKLPSRVKLPGIYTSVGIVMLSIGIVLLWILFSLFAELTVAGTFKDWHFIAQFIFCIFLIFTGLTLILLKMPIKDKDQTRYQ